MNLASVGEFGLIARLKELVGMDSTRVVIGIGDDCAVLEWTDDKYLLVTVDTLVEETHFKFEWATPQDIGWRAMAANLSDIAAMGGMPLAAVVSLAVPLGVDVETIQGIYQGMQLLSATYQTPIIGGDTVRSPNLVHLSLAVLGEVAKDRLLTRSGARPDDALVVTGTLGDAAAGLTILQHGRGTLAPEVEARCLAAHLQPEPRLPEMHQLLDVLRPTACIDLSDGLGSDLRRICEASGVGAEVELDKIPVSVECHNIAAVVGEDVMQYAIAGGEDFELLMTLSPDTVHLLPKLVGEVTTKVIGRITQEPQSIVAVDMEGNRTPLMQGFEHF